MKANWILCGLLTGFAVGALQASTAVEGLSTVGYLEGWRYALKQPGTEWNVGMGKKVDGTAVSMSMTLEEIESQIAVDGYTAERHVTGEKKVFCGYFIDETGLFNYDQWKTGSTGGADGGYPMNNRYDRFGISGENYYFKIVGTVTPSSSGTWTLCIAAQEDSNYYFTLKNSSGITLASKAYGPRNAYPQRDFYTVELTAGENYEIDFRQFRDQVNDWYEISAAKGEYASFNDSDFRLVGSPLTTYVVSFDSNGGDAVSSREVLGGRTLSAVDSPTWEGHTFLYWTSDATPWEGTPSQFDFENTPIESDLVLTAVWTANQTPVIDSVTANPAAVTIVTTYAQTVLNVSASDADAGDTLTYDWSLVGDAPAVYELDDAQSASATATFRGAGTFTFKVAVSDGHETVETTIDVVVSLSETATVFEYVGAENSVKTNDTHYWLSQTDVDVPVESWSNAHKAAWRSTGTSRKQFLLDDRRENAYGLDGYLFPGRCVRVDPSTGTETQVDDVTTATSVQADATAGTIVFNGVTEYVQAFTVGPNAKRGWSGDDGNQILTDSLSYWIDDPLYPLSAEVADFRPSGLCHYDGTGDGSDQVAVIRFSSKVARHPVIRIGFLSSHELFKPLTISVGGATATWSGCRGAQPGMPDWVFFDIKGAKPGDEVLVSLGKTDKQFKRSYIDGIVFDSVVKKSGFCVLIR